VALLVAAQLVVLVTRVASAESVASPTLLYVFAGQSNMTDAAARTDELRRLDPAMTAPQARVEFWGPTEDVASKRWVPLAPPTEVHYALYGSAFGPEIGAGPPLAQLHPHATIAFVKLARPATTLYQDWDPGNPRGMYRALVSEVRTAALQMQATTHRPVIVSGFFWLQGESDAKYADTANAYAENLTSFVRHVRADLRSPLMPFVVAEIPQLMPRYPIFPYCSVVQAAERSVASRVPRVFYVPTADLERSASSPAHFSTLAAVELGQRLANAKFAL
jgi:hypothetical protein